MAGDLKAAAGDSREAVVTTSGTLPEELRARINEAVVGALPGTQVRYATEPGRSAGLSLRLGGAQLGWTVDDYVDGLQAILDDAGARKGRAGAA